MEAEYIVVQAGGLGTRLGKLTKNRPKALVPVNNLPIIFHIFKKYKDKKFIVIGDYKYDVLNTYLRTFADVDYLFLKANGKGNGAGIKDAMNYIPDDTPFMLIWCDLILSDDYVFPKESAPCYVGISGDFKCSWRFENGILEKISSVERGVAGCFMFDKKERLMSLPQEGSFTVWLKDSGIPLKDMNMYGSHETGTIEDLIKLDPGENRCRPYNHMEFKDGKVIKTGLTPEGKKLIDRECRWYEKVTEYGFSGIPEIYSLDPLTMKQIKGTNIFRATLDDEQKKRTIDRLVEKIKELHSYEKVSPDYMGLQEDYFTKTIKRINGIRDVIPFNNDEYININGKSCKNVFMFQDELEKDVRDNLFDAEFGPIHGDCTLTNTMIDEDGEIFYIDARGYFGKRKIFGDLYYDWAKLYYSIEGCFDQFNIKNFEFEISDSAVNYQIHESGWEHLTGYFLDTVGDCNLGKIKLIHAIVWLSLASHCWEDYDSMCLAFYNGLYLWNDWIEEYRSGKVK
ncbi:NTP transferase domain-containing protein [Butyrivibrio sp. AE3004]|uniref:NTP transferase domain-containing protein n=1 Tax=Butyrivibrio sp. AE3004 TaxID=1506994 RepID=UPI000494D0FC|nr:NTP transferase domain-containing protein [Butyrivibrio sp. AE3004]